MFSMLENVQSGDNWCFVLCASVICVSLHRLYTLSMLHVSVDLFWLFDNVSNVINYTMFFLLSHLTLVITVIIAKKINQKQLSCEVRWT